jgi:glutaconate CoA-transferase subunit B
MKEERRMTYNAMELMICCAARLLEDGRSVAVGTGGPCAAAMLAQRTHSPHLVIFFEAGGVAPQLPTMPISVGDSRTFFRGLMATSMADIMETCQRGLIDYTFLGGAQIDAFGNLNSTMIGTDYARPRVRLPGSGGANDLASLCWRILVVTNHDPRRFVNKLDFVTTPGFLSGPGAREAAGLPPGTGPYRDHRPRRAGLSRTHQTNGNHQSAPGYHIGASAQGNQFRTRHPRTAGNHGSTHRSRVDNSPRRG